MASKEQALTCDNFTDKYGRTWHRNGRTRTWRSKGRELEFRVPLKYGLFDYTYLTHLNAESWTVAP